MKQKYFLLLAVLFFTGCATQKVSTVSGDRYDKDKDRTSYFVLPFGSASIPGKWTKTSYNESSRQQFFKNSDGITITVAFTQINSYEFNRDRSKKGFEFLQAFYKCESDYFTNSVKLSQEKIEAREKEHYIIWRVFGVSDHVSYDTYFLFGEKNGYVSNFSVMETGKWTSADKIRILKEMYPEQ